MEKTTKVIIFDCDGTILDTFNLIEQNVLNTFQVVFPDYSLTMEEAHAFFGPHLDDSFKKYTNDEKMIQKAIEVYRQFNYQLTPHYIKAFEGIEELLIKLKQYQFQIVIVSNKVSDAIMQGLKICELDKYIDMIIGAEKLSKPKPDPDGIIQVLNYYQIKSSLFIGDTIIDIDTGKNAGIRTVGVTWCKTTRETFVKEGADYVVDNPLEILPLVEEFYDL